MNVYSQVCMYNSVYFGYFKAAVEQSSQLAQAALHL